jgi:adenine deaminase
MASSVAHDAHNIVVVGANDEDMVAAVREIERLQGGLVISRNGAIVDRLPLPLGGLMSAFSIRIRIPGREREERHAAPPSPFIMPVRWLAIGACQLDPAEY